MSFKLVMPSNHLILCRPLLPLPSIFCSIRVFSNKSDLRSRWPKYWSFNFSINPSNEYSDWSPLGWTGSISLQSKRLSRVLSNTAVQKQLNCYSSTLQHLAFFIVQRSHPYMTTGKTITLTRRTFVGQVMSLLFNMLSRSIIAFLHYIKQKETMTIFTENYKKAKTNGIKSDIIGDPFSCGSDLKSGWEWVPCCSYASVSWSRC